MDILIGILQIILVLVSLFLILVVLMQPGSANGGMGAAMGGGAAESALGAESSSVLSRITTRTAITFFVFVLGLNLLILAVHGGDKALAEDSLPEFEVPTAEETEAATANMLNNLIDSAIESKANATAAGLEEAAEGVKAEVQEEAGAMVEEGQEAVEEAVPAAE